MRSALVKILLLAAVFNCAAQSKGKIETIKGFKSAHVKARNIEVWLPPDYAANKTRKYPVLYMNDGQNVFNPDTSTKGVAWEADDIASNLIARENMQPVIIVAIWSSEDRFYEYLPEKATSLMNPDDITAIKKIAPPKDGYEVEFLGDEYLEFLVKELKPHIDKNYRTLSDAASTSICGSSMGGLISLYAICEYPDVFGQAACVSTHWPIFHDDSYYAAIEGMRKYFWESIPSPKNHRIYFDYGTAGLDKYYEESQREVDAIMKQKDYTLGENWITIKAQDAEHDEKAWQERFPGVLNFLYVKNETK